MFEPENELDTSVELSVTRMHGCGSVYGSSNTWWLECPCCVPLVGVEVRDSMDAGVFTSALFTD
jgi:hypothetical protein